METRDMNLELYVAPEVEMLEFAVEAGFAGSGEQIPDMGEGDSGSAE